MMLIAAGWITALLLVGGVALDRALTNLVSNQFDEQLAISLNSMVLSAELDPFGEVRFNRILGDQRFLEPNSGFYWQIDGEGVPPYASRSLWDNLLEIREDARAYEPIFYNSSQFENEDLRIAQRTVALPGSDVEWQFVVAGSREDLDQQLADIRAILVWSFAVLGIGLFLMAMAQTWYGLGPLRRVRKAIARIRTTGTNRVTDPLPLEVQPMVDELNALLEHSEKQAEEARTHAGNLAHALKTPLTVLNNAASAGAPDLDRTVMREAAVMRRQVDHHLARARAVGRRAVGLSRASALDSAVAVERAVSRLYPDVRFDIDGKGEGEVAVERQDLDEMIGNLIENAAKYGGGSVFVTVDAEPDAETCAILVEDDGTGIPEAKRAEIFGRGARLDTEKPGTGLGLAIVRDVAVIYGGDVQLGESEDLGGLLVTLRLPRAAS
ncbi:HAMP domain-containing sensor histidine kinase [Aurantiacibacter sp. MUD11]|uniref:sensor histidine kinase n=1 Tax=Aurantiacibacter sp. MUD11 TaxID=3003265 RepID=UPI0022AAC9F2|nr:HAMP domain-containing sensor histidine kinase [Aurantiacibacter sp. MUD11]WAT18677.1 HAMP domain-containing sensor histidine kinase [Aurantiacibacter sp. MUD11]